MKPVEAPTLAWTQADFIREGIELPEKLLVDNLHSEGELMDQDDIREWLSDTYKTFCIIREQDEARFTELFNVFTKDISYLVTIGKISEEEAALALNKEDYTF